MITFSDGMSFDVAGPLRPTYRSDGWYVVGDNMLCPVDSYEKALELIKVMESDNLKKNQ